jgi:hypothetical protein
LCKILGGKFAKMFFQPHDVKNIFESVVLGRIKIFWSEVGKHLPVIVLNKINDVEKFGNGVTVTGRPAGLKEKIPRSAVDQMDWPR